MKASEYILRLTLEGRHEEAQRLAHQIAELYKEDPTKGPLTTEDLDGACGFCGYVFTESDCQHEVMNRIACDRCYLDLGGK